MKKYRTMVVKYGYVIVEAENETEALAKTREMNENDFDWSDFDDEQILEEVDYEIEY